jgi:Protein of unknown function (DUF3634)
VNLLMILPLGLLVGWGLFFALRPRSVFVVRVIDGVPRVARGQVTREFLREIGDACARNGVRRAEVRGVADGRRINLVFSGGVPERCRQQLRNLWNISGWSAGVRQPRRIG